MQMVFNELSLPENEMDENKAIQIFEQFINTYSEAVKKKNGFDRGILTGSDLKLLTLSRGYTVSKWRNHIKDREILRRFMNMCDRQIMIDFCQDESELICEKGSGKGLLAAYENAGFGISFVYDSYWEAYEIPCDYYTIMDDTISFVKVCNLSHPNQLEEHAQHIREVRERELSRINTPEQLLDGLNILFPSLIFHEVALNQLKGEVQTYHIPALCSKLMCLEQYFAKWDGRKFDEAAFPSRSVTPQSKETLKRFKKQHTFSFPDEQIIVSYHMRYTGNIPGRIYFHPAGWLKKAYVCSLTTKLPTVSEPKMHI